MQNQVNFFKNITNFMLVCIIIFSSVNYIIINDFSSPYPKKKTSDTSSHSIKTRYSVNEHNKKIVSFISNTTNYLSSNKNLKARTDGLISPLGLASYSTYTNQITITSNSQFPSFGFAGTGTRADPYVLSNKSFTYLGSLTETITISNTNAYFEIKDSTVSSGLNKFVHLNNVTNGLFLNNTITDMYYPFYIEGPSSNITITNNTLTAGLYGQDGIVDQSTVGSVTIFNNTIKNFSNSGIILSPLNKDNIVQNNTVDGNLLNGISILGINIQNSNNSIKNNNLTNNYFYLQTTNVYSYTLNQLEFSNNYVNNLPVDFINNIDKPTFDTHPAEIIVFNSSNVTLKDLPVLNGPFIIANCKNVIISNITIKDSIYTGMELNFDDNITVANNSIINVEGEGIKLFSYSNATIINNNLSSAFVNCVGTCSGLDISITGENSTISYNNIENFVYGIKLFGYTNDNIQGNIIRNVTAYAMQITTNNYGTVLESFKDNQFYNNSIQLSNLPATNDFSNNTFENAPIVMLYNIKNQILAPNTTIPLVYGQLYIQNASFVELKNLKVLYDVYIQTSTNFTLNNVVIQDHGLTMSDSSNITIENNMISSTMNGLYIQPNISYRYNLIIRNNTIIGKPTTSASWEGIYISGWSNVVIENNTIKYFPTGIFISQDDNCNVVNNKLYESDGPSWGGTAGVYLSYPQAMNNYIGNNDIKYFYEGIFVNYNVVYFNEFYNNTIIYSYYGINLQSTNSSFNNNNISNTSVGLNLNNANYNNFTSNTISYSSNTQILLTQSSFNTFSSNTFTHSLYFQNIELKTSSVNNSFIGNNFTYNNNWVHFDSTSGNNTVKNNIFLDTLYVALKIESAYNIITNNDFIGNNWTNTNFPPGKQILITNASNIVLGNYYSDHSNLDFNWDGIADSPYTNFGSTLIDPYPKVRPIFMPDTIAPKLFILPGNNTVFNANGFILSYNISERSVNLIYINGIFNKSLLASGTNMAYLGDGTYNITIVSTDLAGNTAKITTIVTIDTNPPVIIFISPISITYNSSSVNVTYMVQEKSNYSVIIYINNIANTSTLSNNTLWIFQEGLNNLTIYTIDQAGNSASYTIFFSVDTSPPVLAILNPTNSTYTTAYIILDYSISDYSSYNTQIYIDDNANNTILNPSAKIYLTNGYHNVTFVVTDVFGHKTIESVYFSLDIYPTIDIYSITNTTYNVHELKLNYTYAYATQVAVYNDSALLQGTVLNGTIFYFNDGYHNITIVVTNAKGKSVLESVIFLIDTTKPTIQITSPTSTTYTSGDIHLNYQIFESNEYSTTILLDGKTNTTTLDSGSTLQLTDGVHTITIAVTDIAGNVGSTTVTFTISTPPSSSNSSTTQSSIPSPNTSQSNSSTSNTSTSKPTPLGILPILMGVAFITSLRFRQKRKRNSK